MEFEPYMSQILKIPKSSYTLSDLEVDWIVGPIPIDDNNGKEFIHKITLGNLQILRNQDSDFLSLHPNCKFSPNYFSAQQYKICILYYLE